MSTPSSDDKKPHFFLNLNGFLQRKFKSETNRFPPLKPLKQKQKELLYKTFNYSLFKINSYRFLRDNFAGRMKTDVNEESFNVKKKVIEEKKIRNQQLINLKLSMNSYNYTSLRPLYNARFPTSKESKENKINEYRELKREFDSRFRSFLHKNKSIIASERKIKLQYKNKGKDSLCNCRVVNMTDTHCGAWKCNDFLSYKCKVKKCNEDGKIKVKGKRDFKKEIINSLLKYKENISTDQPFSLVTMDMTPRKKLAYIKKVIKHEDQRIEKMKIDMTLLLVRNKDILKKHKGHAMTQKIL